MLQVLKGFYKRLLQVLKGILNRLLQVLKVFAIANNRILLNYNQIEKLNPLNLSNNYAQKKPHSNRSRAFSYCKTLY